jgi:TetR/AcrR family transcriptional repressor of nem operon
VDTRERILDVAQALVQTIGSNAMSYQHISEAVGIRKASIHHHFPTKADLIDALVARYSERFFTLVDGILNSRHTGRHKLREYIGLFEATLREGDQNKACAMGMLGAEAQCLGAVALDRVKLFYSQNEQRLAVILDEGRRDGSLHFDGPSAATAGVIFSLLEGEMLVARGRGSADHFRVTADQLLRMLKG